MADAADINNDDVSFHNAVQVQNALIVGRFRFKAEVTGKSVMPRDIRLIVSNEYIAEPVRQFLFGQAGQDTTHGVEQQLNEIAKKSSDSQTLAQQLREKFDTSRNLAQAVCKSDMTAVQSARQMLVDTYFNALGEKLAEVKVPEIASVFCEFKRERSNAPLLR